jgi:superfamily II DNA/RNA helicase
MDKFKKLGLSKELLSTLNTADISEPTEIQERAIPSALEGKDIIGGSSTGSGKTLVFSAPIIENIKSNGKVQALILTPTRELAEQVSSSIKLFSKNRKLSISAVYGGMAIGPQIRGLSRADIVVGTPGRILDHLKRKTLYLERVQILVLDEVDRMFDMGFQKDVEKIIEFCPQKRQTMLFSATITPVIDRLAKKHTKDPVEIKVDSSLDPSKLKQIYYDVPTNRKFSLLVHLLKNEDSKLVMVFSNTRRNADFIAANLKKEGLKAEVIHGGLSQNQRTRTLAEFHKKGIHFLICTDVAARGLDIKEVTHVYNYDLPPVSTDYIHRIGRTARAGKDGMAISLIAERDRENFRNVLNRGTLNIEEKPIPEFGNIRVKVERSQDSGRDRGRGRGGDSRGGSRDSRGSSGSRGGSRSPGGYSRSGSRGGSRSFGSRDRGSSGSSGRDSGSSGRDSRGGSGSYSRTGDSKGEGKYSGSGRSGKSYAGGRSVGGYSRGGSRGGDSRGDRGRSDFGRRKPRKGNHGRN